MGASFKHNTSFVSRLSTIRRHKSPIPPSQQQPQPQPQPQSPTTTTTTAAAASSPANQQTAVQSSAGRAPSGQPSAQLASLEEQSVAAAAAASRRSTDPAENHKNNSQPPGQLASSALYAPLALVGATSQPGIDFAETLPPPSRLNQGNQQQQPEKQLLVTSDGANGSHQTRLARLDSTKSTIGVNTSTGTSRAAIIPSICTHSASFDNSTTVVAPSVDQASSLQQKPLRTILRNRLLPVDQQQHQQIADQQQQQAASNGSAPTSPTKRSVGYEKSANKSAVSVGGLSASIFFQRNNNNSDGK